MNRRRWIIFNVNKRRETLDQVLCRSVETIRAAKTKSIRFLFLFGILFECWLFSLDFLCAQLFVVSLFAAAAAAALMSLMLSSTGSQAAGIGGADVARGRGLSGGGTLEKHRNNENLPPHERWPITRRCQLIGWVSSEPTTSWGLWWQQDTEHRLGKCLLCSVYCFLTQQHWSTPPSGKWRAKGCGWSLCRGLEELSYSLGVSSCRGRYCSSTFSSFWAAF